MKNFCFTPGGGSDWMAREGGGAREGGIWSTRWTDWEAENLEKETREGCTLCVRLSPPKYVWEAAKNW